MAYYYLKHYFMPDFNHKHLRPVAMADGNVNAHYLGYVQNVVAGQVLAELVQLETLPEGVIPHRVGQPDTSTECVPLPDLPDGYPEPKELPLATPRHTEGSKDFLSRMGDIDPRFIYDAPVFPLGPNCTRDPQHPNRIVALANGYCFYHDGFITVKKLLNVRQDVNFHTGNITYVEDIVVHGDVFPGFSLCGKNIRVKGRVDGGTIRARGDVVIEHGIKGSPKALLKAEGTVRLAYCEHARIITPGNIVIDGACIHSELYVGGSLIVKGRLQGGTVYANGMVFVQEQLGGGQGAPTQIELGYSPQEYLYLQRLKEFHEEQTARLRFYTAHSRKGTYMEEECAPLIELASQKLAVVAEMQRKAWQTFSMDAANTASNRIIVPGTVYPGVEISIGRAYRKIVDAVSDVSFCLAEDEIVSISPAVPKGFSLENVHTSSPRNGK